MANYILRRRRRLIPAPVGITLVVVLLMKPIPADAVRIRPPTKANRLRRGSIEAWPRSVPNLTSA